MNRNTFKTHLVFTVILHFRNPRSECDIYYRERSAAKRSGIEQIYAANANGIHHGREKLQLQNAIHFQTTFLPKKLRREDRKCS